MGFDFVANTVSFAQNRVSHKPVLRPEISSLETVRSESNQVFEFLILLKPTSVTECFDGDCVDLIEMLGFGPKDAIISYDMAD